MLNRRELLQSAAWAISLPSVLQPEKRIDFREYSGLLDGFRYRVIEDLNPDHVWHEISAVMNAICRKHGGTWRMCKAMRQHLVTEVHWNRPDGEPVSWSFDADEPWINDREWFWTIYQRIGWMLEDAGLNPFRVWRVCVR